MGLARACRTMFSCSSPMWSTPKFQIAWIIILSVTVAMMHLLGRIQFTTKHFFHYITMLLYILTVYADTNIPMGVNSPATFP